MNVGDIYWVELPPRGGHAQAGRRPALIFQSDARAANLPTVLVIPLTTQIDALRFPGTILIEADERNGLHRHSVALVFQLTAIDRRFIANRLGEVAAHMLQQIRLALDELTGRV